MKYERAVEILREHYGLSDCEVSHIEGGVTNTTYLVTSSDGTQYIVQKLNQIFTNETVIDYQKLSKDLIAQGWDLQQLIPTIDGRVCVADQQEIWRLLTYIPADPVSDHTSVDLMHGAGSLLARLHRSLAMSAHVPVYTIPHCHDTPYLLHTLDELSEQLVGESHELAEQVLSAYRTLDPLPSAPKQLIHGDPRTTNILFRNGKPYTYIDFDMVMIGTVWVDIGDLLRAACGDTTQTHAQYNSEYIDAIIDGYATAAGLTGSPDLFHSIAMNAMRTIALELAARFLIDIVYDDHFGWDGSLFVSRSEHNLARAQAQCQIYVHSMLHEDLTPVLP